MPKADFFRLLGLFVSKGFFGADLCSRLRSELHSAARTAATVRERGADFTVDPGVRSAQWIAVPDSVVSLVQSPLLALKPSLEKHFKLTLASCQSPQFLAYKAGDFYRPHRDSSPDPDAASRVRERRVSAIIFLNGASDEPQDNSYGGGALTFYGLLDDPRSQSFGLPLAGEEGLLVAFRSDIVHEVTPVAHGERLTIACWYL